MKLYRKRRTGIRLPCSSRRRSSSGHHRGRRLQWRQLHQQKTRAPLSVSYDHFPQFINVRDLSSTKTSVVVIDHEVNPLLIFLLRQKPTSLSCSFLTCSTLRSGSLPSSATPSITLSSSRARFSSPSRFDGPSLLAAREGLQAVGEASTRTLLRFKARTIIPCRVSTQFID